MSLGAGDRGPESEPSTAAHTDAGLTSPYTLVGPPADKHDTITDRDRPETATTTATNGAVPAGASRVGRPLLC